MDVTESWGPAAAGDLDLYAGSAVAPTTNRPPASARARWHVEGAAIVVKSAVLLVTTLALVPIMAWQHVLGAQFYLAFLVAVHLLGIVIFAWGVRGKRLAATARGVVVRLTGLGVLATLLAWVGKGVTAGLGSALFWASLGGIWALHTAGLALLHVRPRDVNAADTSLCPFL